MDLPGKSAVVRNARSLASQCRSGSGLIRHPAARAQGLAEEERLARSLGLMDSRWDAGWQAAHPGIVDLMRARGAVGAGGAEATTGARRQLEARAAHDTYARLRQLTMPTLVCAGRFDGIAPLANVEALAAQVPRSTLQVFDGGHAFLLQDPTAWPAIVAFLAGGQPST